MKTIKKALCLLAAICMIVCITACDKAETATDITKKTTVPRTTVATLDSVKGSAQKGVIDCTEIKLGDIIDRIYEKYPKRPADGSQAAQNNTNGVYLTETIGTELTRFMYGDMQFYTVNGKDSQGVAVIVTSGKAYGFKCGYHFKSDVTAALGEPTSRGALPQKERYFMFGNEAAERLTYKFDKKRLDFIIVDGKLSHIVLSDSAVYTGFSG